jgi:hypothetical protein
VTIYTPRGLKIRIPVPYAFGLMSRLHPKVSPFHILKTTEGIESISGMLAIIGGLIAFSMKLTPLQIGMTVFGSEIIGILVNIFGFFFLPGLVTLGTIYSYISGFGILLIVVSIFGYLLTGWQGVLAFFIGKLLARVIYYPCEYFVAKRYAKLIGHPLTTSEVNFFNAYRIHASRHGVTLDIDLKEEELEEANWGNCFEEFATEWPEIVQRFSID